MLKGNRRKVNIITLKVVADQEVSLNELYEAIALNLVEPEWIEDIQDTEKWIVEEAEDSDEGSIINTL